MEWVPATKGGHENQSATTAYASNATECAAPSWTCDGYDAAYYRLRRWAVPLAWKLGTGDASEDLFQKALLSLQRKYDLRDPRFAKFLRRRLRSRCRGAYRTEVKRRVRFVRLPDGFEEQFPSDPPELAGPNDLWLILHLCIDALPETQRVLLHIYYWEDSSLAKAAEYLGMSMMAVKALLFRIRRKLRAQLRNHPDWVKNCR